MMVCCEFCGVGDDLDNMFNGTITSSNGNKTSFTICEGCAHSNKHIFTDVVSVKDVHKALTQNGFD